MTAVQPDPQVLEGRFIRLVPQTKEMLPELFDVLGSEVVFQGGWGGGPAGYTTTREQFVEFGEQYFAWDTGIPFAVQIIGGPDDGRIVGTTTLGDFEPAVEHAHIGWTAYAPSVWGTAVNPEAKLLLLGLAFDSGFGRVKIQADVRNTRSRAAIAGLGATFEGIARRDRQRADGTWRDSAVFSVIVDDWPRVKAGLEERVARHSEPVRLGQV
ncbi:GNAT family N-acetyltransferase [Naasia lichenicola]|uniref:GNAT family N-acetyltransferase n=1 Tax=Naasia lichenicola TaxID=2565933 RepID=A0A4S4FI78_9MICO|nr:GNAT family protein [Naasia lichenicola]THG29542.1 GNAT family N-acetyltransferase [Naasia lichenicola]